jgi:hypothetical protein
MVALLLGASTLVIGALGWYGCRAGCRIQEWGRRMDEMDRIFQIAGEHAAHQHYPVSPARVVAGRPIGGFVAGPAASK